MDTQQLLRAIRDAAPQRGQANDAAGCWPVAAVCC